MTGTSLGVCNNYLHLQLLCTLAITKSARFPRAVTIYNSDTEIDDAGCHTVHDVCPSTSVGGGVGYASTSSYGDRVHDRLDAGRSSYEL